MTIFIYRLDGGLVVFKEPLKIAITADGILKIWGHSSEIQSYKVVPQGKEKCGKVSDKENRKLVIEAIEDSIAYDKFARFVEVQNVERTSYEH